MDDKKFQQGFMNFMVAFDQILEEHNCKDAVWEFTDDGKVLIRSPEGAEIILNVITKSKEEEN